MVKNSIGKNSCSWDGRKMICHCLSKFLTLFLWRVKKYKSIGINEHLLGYLIQRTHITCCINVANLPYKYVFSAHSYIGDGQLYIISKSYLEPLDIPRLSVD